MFCMFFVRFCMYLYDLYVFVCICTGLCVCIDMYLYVCIYFVVITSGWEIVGNVHLHLHPYLMLHNKEFWHALVHIPDATLQMGWGGVGWTGGWEILLVLPTYLMLREGMFTYTCTRTLCFIANGVWAGQVIEKRLSCSLRRRMISYSTAFTSISILHFSKSDGWGDWRRQQYHWPPKMLCARAPRSTSQRWYCCGCTSIASTYLCQFHAIWAVSKTLCHPPIHTYIGFPLSLSSRSLKKIG